MAERLIDPMKKPIKTKFGDFTIPAGFNAEDFIIVPPMMSEGLPTVVLNPNRFQSSTQSSSFSGSFSSSGSTGLQQAQRIPIPRLAGQAPLSSVNAPLFFQTRMEFGQPVSVPVNLNRGSLIAANPGPSIPGEDWRGNYLPPGAQRERMNRPNKDTNQVDTMKNYALSKQKRIMQQMILEAQLKAGASNEMSVLLNRNNENTKRVMINRGLGEIPDRGRAMVAPMNSFSSSMNTGSV